MLIKKKPIRKSNFATRKLINRKAIKSRFARLDSHDLESLANKVADSFAEMLEEHNEYTDVDKDVISPYSNKYFEVETETAFCPLAQELDFKYIAGPKEEFEEAATIYEKIAEEDFKESDDINIAYNNATFVWLGLKARIEVSDNKRWRPDYCKVIGFLRYDNSWGYECFYEKAIELTDDEDVDLANIEKAAHEALKSMGLERR